MKCIIVDKVCINCGKVDSIECSSTVNILNITEDTFGKNIDSLNEYQKSNLNITHPNIWERLISFGVASFKHINNGLQKTPKYLQEERLKICEGCPLYDNGTCKKCGCVLSIKTSWASEQCPLDPPKWEKYQQEKGGCGCGG